MREVVKQFPSASFRFFQLPPRWDGNKVDDMKANRRLVLLILFLATTAAFAQPEPGPENGGLRLRLVASPHSDTNAEGYDVHVDLISVTNRDITLHSEVRGENPDIKGLLEGEISIETSPAIAPWLGQVLSSIFTHPPQLEYVLKAGEVLSMDWHTTGRHLKNKVSDPIDIQDPEFPFPGLYSVRATLAVKIGDHSVSLRSNEQLISAGGGRDVPKSTHGHLTQVDADAKTARLDLGSLQKIERGDEFRIQSSYIGYAWKLTITQVASNYSLGHFERLLREPATSPTNLPAQVTQATSNHQASHAQDFSNPEFLPNERSWVSLMPKK